MTKFSFTGEIDAYGQPLSQISIAVPRGKDPRTGGELAQHGGVYDPARGYDATIQYTRHIYIDPAFGTGGEFPAPGTPEDACAPAFAGQYVVDRAKQARSYEARNDGGMSVFALRDILLGGTPDTWTGLGNLPEHGPHLLALGNTYYDGAAFDGDDFGEMGAYGVPVRTEALMVQPAELDTVYGSAPGDHPAPFYNTGTAPDWSALPADFVSALQHDLCGYVYHEAGGDEDYVAGYYTSAQRTRFDFHDSPTNAKGLPLAMQDVFGNEATIAYDGYKLLPVLVTDPLGMQTSAEYDYRLLQPHRVTDPNQNVSAFAFTPLGLMHKTALLGKDNNTEGDTLEHPGVKLEYDLFAFVNDGEPVWVRTTQRVHHINADYLSTLPTEEQNATIVAVEYSDGFGRQLQTRTQAEDLLFGDAQLGDSGLPADQTAANAPAVGTLSADNVVVSGAKRYNNKGKVVEQWEPYFAQDWLCHSGLDPESPDLRPGQRVRIYYDALGRPQRTVNPDATEQRVVYGRPNLLNTPSAFSPSPWERFTYDANDLAPITHPGNTLSATHHWTPKSELIDALGRTVRTIEHITTLSPAGAGDTQVRADDVVMKYRYDIKGQLLEVTDPLDRICFSHLYDTAGNNLWTEHLDSGVKKLAVDAQGKPLYSTDAKGAQVFTAYDALHRPLKIWAKDATGESTTLRQHLLYGDAAHPVPPAANMNGKLWKHHDEAGLAVIGAYDFKGNPLSKTRQVIADSELLGTEKYVLDWSGLNTGLLATQEYLTQLLYDGLNRVRYSILPEELSDGPISELPKELIPTYNRAGALQSIAFAGVQHVAHIAYNAKGQRTLLTRGNHPSGPEFGMMTRYAYDPVTFRLARIRTEKYELVDDEYQPQSGTTQQDTAYEYDLGGNIIKIKERITDCGISGTTLGVDALNKLFAYDPLKRLLSATGRESNTTDNANHWVDKAIPSTPNASHTRAYTELYTYDKLGNILLLDHDAGANSYERHYRYASGNNKLEQLDNDGSPADVYASFTYDANGNQLQQNSERYLEWDAADQLKYFKIDNGTITKQAHYLYAGGQRVKKLVRTGNDLEITVYIDGVYEHRYKAHATTTLLTPQHQNNYYIMDGRSRIATVRLGHAWGDTAPDVYYNLEDHLGTSAVRMEATGANVDREEYYPFGDTCLLTRDKKRYRYVGKEKDSESGLYYYGARYYAAWTCRFVSVDPLAASYAHLNPYNYAGNKPIGDLDIDGMQGTGDTPAPQVYQSGDAKLDAAANRILSDNDCHNVGITTDENQQTTITVNGDIVAKYHPDAGFVDRNDQALKTDDNGYLLGADVSSSPAPQSGSDFRWHPEFGPSGTIGSGHNATISEAPPPEPKKEEFKSYNEENKSAPQQVTEAAEKTAGLTAPVVEKTATKFAEESSFRKSVRRFTHRVSKAFDNVKSGKLYQGIKRALPVASKWLGGLSKVLTPLTIAWEALTDTWDAHTVANGLIWAAGLGLALISAPAALVVGLVVGAVWLATDMDKRIDEKFGRKARPDLWEPFTTKPRSPNGMPTVVP